MTAGSGHRRAAEAVADAARERLPDAGVRCVDLLDDTPAWVRRVYPWIYQFLVQHAPQCWSLGYRLTDSSFVFPMFQWLRRRWNLASARRFIRSVEAWDPDVVIATHFFPTDVFSAMKTAGRLRARVIIVVTDLFPHRFWLAPGPDALVVGSEEVRRLCEQRGVPSDRLHVLGIPIEAKFRRVKERADIMRELGVDASRRTVLVAAGGMGVGSIEQVVQRLLAAPGAGRLGLQILVVCGDNAQLRQRLASLAAHAAVPVRVFGFVDNMQELMRASDLMVTKAGGLTVMEALAMGLPMVFSGSIPGQEWYNAEHAIQHGAGISAGNPRQAVDNALELCSHPDRLAAMQAKARALGRTDAAPAIIEQLVIPHVHA